MEASLGTFLGDVLDRTQRALGDDLLGAFVVGSLAYGDANAVSSDVDVLVVAAAAPPDVASRRFAEDIADAGAECPWAGIECVVYRREVLASPRYPLAYEVNVTNGPARPWHVSTGGDPPHWFMLDVAMARERSIVLYGPPASELIGEPARSDVAEAIADALSWHRAHEPGSPNTVLNACRSWHWLVTGRWRSKTEAGRWALGEDGDPELIRSALDLRAGGRRGGLDAARVRRLLDHVGRVAAQIAP